MSTRSTTSSRALLYFSERVEDAAETVKGLVGGGGGGSGIGGVGGSKYIDTSDDTIRAQLESDRDEVRLEGLKMVVALISKGRDASGYFASVVKLSSNGNLEIRKLVYIVVRRYARRQPDVALLGINSFQRDLHDRNEVVRTMALRVLTGLRLRLAASVVQLAISKCVRDSSFYVRRAAALALIKSCNVVPDARVTFKAHVSTLLNDRHPGVLSASVVAWSLLFPTSFDLLHPHFRKLCFALVDMDQWGQRESLQVLGLYARRCLPRPTVNEKMDRDTDLLLTKAEDLLCSPNAAVVTAAARLIFALAPPQRHTCIVRPLLRLISTTPPDVEYVALLSCLTLSQTSPTLLRPYVYDFLPRSSRGEPEFATKLKLQIIVHLATRDNAEMILSELMEQAKYNPSEPVAILAVMQAGQWAQECGESDAKLRVNCIKELLQLIKDRRSRHGVVSCAMGVIRRLIEQSDANVAAAMVLRLAPLLFTHVPADTEAAKKKKKLKLVGKGAIRAGAARASIFWLLGQYCRLSVTTRSLQGHTGAEQQQTVANAIGLDVLRRAALNFSREEPDAKLQIITLSTKMFTFLPTVPDVPQAHLTALASLHTYILHLARYDGDFDIRDRARFAKALTDRLDFGQEKDCSAADQSGIKDDKNKDHDGSDDEHLGGVVLRRNQVLHILFESCRSTEHGRDTAPSDTSRVLTWNTLMAAVGASRSASIPERFPDFLTEPWSKPDALPPSAVRDPSSLDSGGGASVSLESPRQPGNESLAGSDVASPVGVGPEFGTPATDADDALLSQLPSNTVRFKYQNLDAFLEGGEDEEQLQEDGKMDERSQDNSVQEYTSSEEEGDEEEEEDEEESEDEASSDDDADSEGESDDAIQNSTRSKRGGNTSQSAPLTPSFAPPVEENAWAQ